MSTNLKTFEVLDGSSVIEKKRIVNCEWIIVYLRCEPLLVRRRPDRQAVGLNDHICNDNNRLDLDTTEEESKQTFGNKTSWMKLTTYETQL